jgi:hypothetical protein
MADLLKHVVESGFPFVGRLIHLFVGGSELHGAKVHGTDDLDIYGVYIEPPEIVLGLDSMPHFVWSTAGDDRRNGPNDVDITLYSLKKWSGLACKGNPTALHFLFAKGALENPLWGEIVSKKHVFLARSCAKQFTGFADDQLKRMTARKDAARKASGPKSRLSTVTTSKPRCILYACFTNVRNSSRRVASPCLARNAISSSAFAPASTLWTES